MAKTYRYRAEGFRPVGNREQYDAMLEMSFGNATAPQRNKKKYRRKTKHKGKAFDSE